MSKLITKKEFIPSAILLAVIIVGALVYPSLPAKVPSHWNVNGEIDGYMGKTFAVYFFPGLILAIYLLMTFLPFIDPLRKNIEKSAKAYFYLKVLLVSFFSLLYVYTIMAAFSGEIFPINLFMFLTLGLLIVGMGFLMPNFKKNYFIGIRTPWTLESEEVWDKTHQRAKKFYVFGGLFVVFGGLLHIPFWFVFAAMMVFLLWPVVDSYFIFKRLEKKKT
ncbi:MAG: DUF1648 domain-containing protein [bacterium]